MQHFPIFLDLHGRTVLILGAGEAAQRKAEPLRQAGAVIRRAARFEPTDLDGCALAIGADADDADLHALSAAARAACIPVNVVDRPELCSYISPAIVDRKPIVIAISSGGAAPVLARLLRARIEAAVPPAFGRLAAIAAEFKAVFRRRWPDMAERRRVLEVLFSGRAADLVFAGQEDAARAEFTAAMTGGVQHTGLVYLVAAGPGAADLLTLRAQRLLGEADVVAHNSAVSAAVVDMARRDSSRLLTDSSQSIADLARTGKKVVWLRHANPPRDADRAALAAAGVIAEIVPGVG